MKISTMFYKNVAQSTRCESQTSFHQKGKNT